MTLTVDQRSRIASWEEIESARAKLKKRERKVEAYEQELSAPAPKKDPAVKQRLSAQDKSLNEAKQDLKRSQQKHQQEADALTSKQHDLQAVERELNQLRSRLEGRENEVVRRERKLEASKQKDSDLAQEVYARDKRVSEREEN
ncbi:hypothetical protein LCGC14_3021810, partial [marine sediment metagenome]